MVSPDQSKMLFALWSTPCFDWCVPCSNLAVLFQRTIIEAIKEVTDERPWLWAVFIIVVVLPIVLIVAYCCMSKVKDFDKFGLLGSLLVCTNPGFGCCHSFWCAGCWLCCVHCCVRLYQTCRVIFIAVILGILFCCCCFLLCTLVAVVDLGCDQQLMQDAAVKW